jgi:hypothetical protein
MRVFRDSSGVEWAITINVTAIKRCRQLIHVDLLGLLDEKFEGISKLMADPVQLVDVIYVLCRDEAQQRNVTDEDFGRAMAGDALERAADAFITELADFFPEPRRRAAIKRAFAAGRSLTDQMLTMAETKGDAAIEAHMAVALREFEKALDRSIGSSGSSPGSSGSTPAPSPSANWT